MKTSSTQDWVIYRKCPESPYISTDDATGSVTISDSNPPSFVIADEDIDGPEDVIQELSFSITVEDSGGLTDDAAVKVIFFKDTDDDGVKDSMDNALFAANPDQLDTNGDGYGNIIDADLNNNGFVFNADLALFRNAFGTFENGGNRELDENFDGDGGVGIGDLAIFRALFGESVESLSLIGDD